MSDGETSEGEFSTKRLREGERGAPVMEFSQPIGGSAAGHSMTISRGQTYGTRREQLDMGRITGTMRGNFTTQGDDPNVPDSSNSPLMRGKKPVATGDVNTPGSGD